MKVNKLSIMWLSVTLLLPPYYFQTFSWSSCSKFSQSAYLICFNLSLVEGGSISISRSVSD